MKIFYRLLQKALRKKIDWLMSLWLWANKQEKKIEKRNNYESKRS